MFGWFAPKLPVSTWEKTWLEARMRWLASKFGIKRLLDAPVILPNDDFFPEPIEATRVGVERVMRQLCVFMRIEFERLRLEIIPDKEMPGAVGEYIRGDKDTIRIAESLLDDPEGLLATMAHELAHVLLLSGGLIDVSVPDHEWVTDLLPVYLGIGVFAANSTLREATINTGAVSWWSIGRRGYLPSRMFGYALALFSFVRGESAPNWTGFLRRDAASSLRDGLRYLAKGGATLFHPDTVRTAGDTTVSSLIQQLRHDSPGFRLDAVWQLGEHGAGAAPALHDLLRLLDDPDTAIPPEVVRTLARLGPSANPAADRLIELLFCKALDLRRSAAEALSSVRGDPDRVFKAAVDMIDDPEMRLWGVNLLRAYTTELAKAWELLLRLFEESVMAGNDEETDAVVTTMLAVRDDAESAIREYTDQFEEPQKLELRQAFRRARFAARSTATVSPPLRHRSP